MNVKTRNIRNQFFYLLFLSFFFSSAALAATDPPVVIVKPDNLTINETGEFLLFCEYDANPASLASVRWLQGGSVLNLNQSRFDGGNPEQTALLVKNATRDDSGSYSCELTNQVGTGMSDNGVAVDVQCELNGCNGFRTSAKGSKTLKRSIGKFEVRKLEPCITFQMKHKELNYALTFTLKTLKLF